MLSDSELGAIAGRHVHVNETGTPLWDKVRDPGMQYVDVDPDADTMAPGFIVRNVACGQWVSGGILVGQRCTGPLLIAFPTDAGPSPGGVTFRYDRLLAPVPAGWTLWYCDGQYVVLHHGYGPTPKLQHKLSRPHVCPSCGSKALIMFSSLECNGVGCKYFKLEASR